MTEKTLLFADLDQLGRAAAGLVEEAAAIAVRERREFSLVLSGGSTPRRLYELLCTEWVDRIPWRQTHLFWADERFVPAEDPESNFGVARELFIAHIPIPPENVHPIETSFTDPVSAAEAYEAILRTRFYDVVPSFDLALLGMGADGHTASLFPDHPLDSPSWVEAVTAPPYRPPKERITLTLKALNGSRKAAFLIAGSDKREALEAIRLGSRTLPAAAIQPKEELIWLIVER